LKILAKLETKYDIPNIIPLSLFMEREKSNLYKKYIDTRAIETDEIKY
jgi:hypothetical protein